MINKGGEKHNLQTIFRGLYEIKKNNLYFTQRKLLLKKRKGIVMKKKKLINSIASIVLAMFTTITTSPNLSLFAAEKEIEADKDIETKTNETLSELSLEERISMMYGTSPNAGNGATKDVTGLTKMNMSDGPMGANGAGFASNFGSGLIAASTWNADAVYEEGRVIGAEAKAKGFQFMLGPGTNIIRDLAGGRTFEYYSEDPLLSGKMAAAYSKGMQTQEVSSTVKHLFANNQEENRNWASANLSERAMHEVYLKPYDLAIEEGGAWNLMTAANRANGVFTSDNRYILTNMSKYDYGLKGIVMTDWCSTRSNEIAAKAGLDVAMPSAGPYANLLTAVRTGKVASSVIDEAAQRVTRLAYLTKSTTNKEGYTPAQRKAGENYDHPTHSEAVLNNAREGEVLLKNEGLLPLSTSTNDKPKIALIGKYVNYNFEQPGLGGSGWVLPFEQITNEAAMKKMYGDQAEFMTPAYQEDTEGNLVNSIEAAKQAAKDADYVIIYAGINKSTPEHSAGHASDTEGNDRLDLNFPDQQRRLINAVSEVAGDKTVVVLSGSVMEVRDWIDGVNAVVSTFYPGQNGATATAEILTGNVNPSGKLTFTWPRRYEDTQSYIFTNETSEEEKHKAKSGDVNYVEGVFEGYRYYDYYKDLKPEFSFGHGLSYAEYDWSDIKLSSNTMDPEDTLKASITLTNKNHVAGKQTVQLYIQDTESTVVRPVKELKGFHKTEIAADGSCEYTFEISKDELSFWDTETHSMKAEAGSFKILIGDAADSIRAEALFTLTKDSQPDEDYTVMQAEDYAEQKGTTLGDVEEIDANIMNYKENQFLMMGGKDSSASWNMNVEEAGKYSIIFRYSNDAFGGNVDGYSESYNKPTDLLINGEICGTYDFQNTRHSNVWNYDSIDVVLQKGENIIALNGTNTSTNLRIDKVIAQKINQWWDDPVPSVDSGGGLEPTDDLIFQAESATIFNNAVISDEAKGFNGTGYVNLKGADSSVNIPVYSPTTVKFRLQFTYSNQSGSVSPCDLYVNGIRKTTLTLGPTEDESDWQYYQTDELTLNSGTNNLLISSKSGQVNLDQVEIIGGMAYRDEEAPIITGTTPSNQTALLNNISIYFSENVKLSSGNVQISDGDNDIRSNIKVEDSTLLIEPDWTKLKTGTHYTVKVANDAITDIADNMMDDAYEFTFMVPEANFSDPLFKYNGTWSDNESYRYAKEGSTVEFWYYGNQSVLRAMDHDAEVNVWVDDFLVPNTVVIEGDGNKDYTFFDTGLQQNGIHNIKIEVTKGTFQFVSAIANNALIEQPLTKNGWTGMGVREASSDPFSNIIDDDRESRWTSLNSQNSSQRDWFGIDFGKPTTLNSLLLVCRTSNVGSEILDYGRSYELFISDDGENWSGPITAQNGSPMYTSITFPTLTTRYVKVVQTGNASNWWSVYEAYGFKMPEKCVPKADSPKTPENVKAESISQQIKLSWSASANASAYEISRDGVIIGKTSELSYVDILDVNDSKMHTYTISALNVIGTVSKPSQEVKVHTDAAITDIPQFDWIADASHSHSTVSPSMAIDDDINSRWTSGVLINRDMWFKVDMKGIFKFDTITIVGNQSDYPTEYEVVISNNGIDWTSIATGSGTPNTINITLERTQRARYVMVKQTSAAPRGDWWSILDFKISLHEVSNPPEDVNKDRLEEVMRAAIMKEQSGYLQETVTPSTWTPYMNALMNADTIMNASDAIQKDVDNAADTLQSAMDDMILKASDKQLEALQRIIESAEVIYEGDSENLIYAELKTAVEAGKQLLNAENRDEISYDQANDAFIMIAKAKDSINQNTMLKALVKLVNIAEAIDLNGIQPAKINALRLAITEAKALITTSSSDIEAIKAVNEKLMNAIQHLERIVNKEELMNLIREMQTLNGSLYTEESWNVLREAMEEAQRIVSNDDASKAEVDTAYHAILSAVAQLELKLDKTALEYYLTQAEVMLTHIHDYIPSSVLNLEREYLKAKVVYESSKTTQLEIETATNTLINVITKARYKADKSVLSNAIKEAEALQKDGYTPSTIKALYKAIADAKAVMENEDALQDDVNRTLAALNKARDALTLENENSNHMNDADKVNNNNDNKNGGISNDKTIVKTGDLTNINSLYALSILAGGTLLVILRRHKRDHK